MRNIAHAPKAGSQVGQILRIEFFFSGINIGVNRVREDVRSKAGKLVQGNLFQRDYFICIWNSSLLPREDYARIIAATSNGHGTLVETQVRPEASRLQP